MKVIIVGGVAGGASVAARLRRLSEKAEIIMIERDEHISYANCGLPYYIGGVIRDKEKLIVQTKEVMKERFDIDIRVKNEVLEVDRANKTVKIKNISNGEIYEESYDKLVLSCGAKPLIPNIEGLATAKNVFSLRNLADTYAIKEKTQQDNIQRAVVIGGGFIGIEMAENLKELGIQVTLVEKLPQVLRNFDFEMAQFIHTELINNGIEIILNDGIKSFAENGKKVLLDSGKSLDTDMTILAMGVTPENTLVKDSVSLGERGHIKVDDNFNVYSKEGETDKDVYAIGDMIEVFNTLDDTPYAVPLAWGANRQGRLVADNIAGLCPKKSRISGTSALKVFNLTAASSGANESMLKAKNISYKAIHAHRSNHASYYPGSSNIAMKILYEEKSGRIYGIQAIGREGTEKRVDIIATVMRLNGSVYDLSDLELCYAPPYSSAKDPVNILGYIAENISSYKMYKMVYHDQIDDIVAKGGMLLDVRTPFEFANGHIKGSINVPVDEFRTKIKEVELDKDKPIYIACQVGLKAYIAIRILTQMGYRKLYNLSGGYVTYKTYKYDYSQKVIQQFSKGGDDMLKEIAEDTKCEVIDVSGIQCPGPLMATYKAVEGIEDGNKLKVISTDGGFANDIKSWCETNGHTLLSMNNEKGKYTAILQKGQKTHVSQSGDQKNATIVVFSGDMDKVIASMIIAQGAAAQGKNVTMFFTFWGLNALRKQEKVKVNKSLVEKMFGVMMPRGAAKLGLSRMNMAGMGSKMIKSIMRQKNVDDLPTMIRKAQEVGVKMIACTMSMDLMGIKEEELLNNIEYAGVATYISKNENVGTTLFI